MASIDKRANGRYLARWREYPGAPQKTRTFHRKKDAERFLDHIRGDLARGLYIDPAGGQIPFREYAEEWRAAQMHRAPPPSRPRPTSADTPIPPSAIGPWAPSAAARSKGG